MTVLEENRKAAAVTAALAWASVLSKSKGTAVMRRGWGCSSGRFCRKSYEWTPFHRLLRRLFLRLLKPEPSLWWRLQLLSANDWNRLIPTCPSKDVKEAILCPSPTPCPCNSNTKHPWVCGVQPIQPSCLQQLQTGREPKHQQSGNEFLWNKYPKATQATWQATDAIYEIQS